MRLRDTCDAESPGGACGSVPEPSRGPCRRPVAGHLWIVCGACLPPWLGGDGDGLVLDVGCVGGVRVERSWRVEQAAAESFLLAADRRGVHEAPPAGSGPG